MITPMNKYSLVLFHKDYKLFLERLQELGLVDITITAWDPTDKQRDLMGEIERYRQATVKLQGIRARLDADEDSGTETRFHGKTATPYQNTEAAFNAYTEASRRLDELHADLTKINKEIEELRPWGSFDVQQIEQLRSQGLEIHFYSLFIKEFEDKQAEWSEQYLVREISRDSLRSYFVIVAPSDAPYTVDAQENKTPEGDFSHKELEKQSAEREIDRQEAVLTGLLPYLDAFELERNNLMDRLHLEQVAESGEKAADDTLIILEGWAPVENEVEVTAALNETGAFYVQERPTPDDEVPVKLKNNRFSRLFELIGNFYSLPKYGTMDLTPFFGPFYMIFFGFCLADSGYGLLLFLGGLYMLFRGGDKLNSVSKLTMLCGVATIIFGFFAGSFFGVQLGEIGSFAKLHAGALDTDNLFTLALGLGIFQLLFGMVLKVINTTQVYGFKYALATLGWMIVILAGLAAYLLPQFGIEGFTMKSLPFLITAGIGLFMMLFLNSPGKNPLVNFGAGLWNTYNDVTGLLGDVLSYIRLFAIGLSGGILAMVFNQLAFGLSPDIPVLRQLCILIILLIGHGINLFMSTLSSFVHPMRLTFVEFYKSAGFESTQRKYKPLKKQE